jgi:hypothetical protein
MTRTQTSLPGNPKDALAAFLLELHDLYYDWYERSVNRHYAIWLPLHLAALLIGAATTVVAALASDEALAGHGIGRVLLVILPLLGTALSTAVVQSRLHQRYQLRENGRRQVQVLWNEGRRRFAAATAPEEFSAIHEELEKRLDQIEGEQGASFFSLVATAAPTQKASS